MIHFSLNVLWFSAIFMCHPVFCIRLATVANKLCLQYGVDAQKCCSQCLNVR